MQQKPKPKKGGESKYAKKVRERVESEREERNAAADSMLRRLKATPTAVAQPAPAKAAAAPATAKARLLVDDFFMPPDIVAAFRQSGYDCVYNRDMKAKGDKLQALFDEANRTDRILVTPNVKFAKNPTFNLLGTKGLVVLPSAHHDGRDAAMKGYQHLMTNLLPSSPFVEWRGHVVRYRAQSGLVERYHLRNAKDLEAYREDSRSMRDEGERFMDAPKAGNAPGRPSGAAPASGPHHRR